MLVLSRKSGESVWVGKTIQVKVLEIQGGKVKLGFVAPPNVPVQRDEIRGTYAPRGVGAWSECVAVGELCRS
jgi:carbon storage regulator